MLPPVKRDHRPGARRPRDPALGARLHQLPDRLRLAADAQAALEGTGISVPPLESYADRLWDYWERNLDPDLFKDRSLSRRDRRQGRADHRRLVAASARRRAIKVRRRRRRSCCWSPARRRSSRRPRRRSRRPAARAHIHPCDLSDLDDVERMAEEVLDRARPRRRPGQQRRAARSGARSRSPTTASTTSSARCSSTTSARCG